MDEEPALPFDGPVVRVGTPWRSVLALGCYASSDGGATWEDRALALQAISTKADIWPIEGPDDARFARVLMGQLLYWQGRGVRVGLEKPLPGRDRWGGETPPDFVLHLPDGQLVVIVRRRESIARNPAQRERERRLRGLSEVHSLVRLERGKAPEEVVRLLTGIVMAAAEATGHAQDG